MVTALTSNAEKTRGEIRLQYEIAKHSHQLKQPRQGFDNEVNTRSIDLATEGLADYVHRQLTDLCGISLENALTIVNYVLTQKTEVNIADTYRLNIISTLIVLSKFLNHNPFKDMREEDILLYLDSLRKPEASDPLHQWIGTYNEKRQRLVKFFRWFYNPDKMASDRQTPEFMKHIPALKRKEQSSTIPGICGPKKKISCY
jgi:hypothetical protein